MKGFRISTAVWGVVSVAIYLCAIYLLLLYFNASDKEKKTVFVEKNAPRIQVGLASQATPAKLKKTKRQNKKPPTRKKKEKLNQKTVPQKKKIQKRTSKKDVPKKRDKRIAKSLQVKKSSPKKQAKAKKHKVRKKEVAKKHTLEKKHIRHTHTSTKDLFASVKTPVHPHPVTQKGHRPTPSHDASHRQGKSLKRQKEMRKGVENAYLAKVQRLLEQWPAQSDFAGEKVKVLLKIRPDGYFDFTLVRRSANPAFNAALSDYLKQLQEFGFGPHKGGRTYLFEAEFIAKE